MKYFKIYRVRKYYNGKFMGIARFTTEERALNFKDEWDSQGEEYTAEIVW